jgi:hypothetical protein
MRKAKAKAKLVLRQEHIRILEARDLRRVAGGFDTEVINSCTQQHPQAAASQANAAGCG